MVARVRFKNDFSTIGDQEKKETTGMCTGKHGGVSIACYDWKRPKTESNFTMIISIWL